MLVQEYHPGVEDYVQVLMHEGEAFTVGEYLGEHHMPLAGGVTVQRITCRHEPVVADAVRAAQSHWLGRHRGGTVPLRAGDAATISSWKSIPRFIGGLPTVIMAGFHAPFLLWQSHFEPATMRRPVFRLGLRTRILGGDANWTLGMLRRDPLPPGQKHLSKLGALARFAWNCGPWTKDDSFSFGDMKPFFVDCVQMAKRLKSKSIDIIGNPETQSPQS